MELVKSEIELLREVARKTDDLNRRIVKCITVLGVAWAIALSIVTFIAFAYAFSTPYPEQYQTIEGTVQKQGGYAP